MAPAISLEFGSWYIRNTENAAGATTTLKNTAAPSQAASNSKQIFLSLISVY
jgi:hypothetical protein